MLSGMIVCYFAMLSIQRMVRLPEYQFQADSCQLLRPLAILHRPKAGMIAVSKAVWSIIAAMQLIGPLVSNYRHAQVCPAKQIRATQ